MVKFSEEAKSLHASDIREILKVTENPEIISFAGGLPAPELFPIDEMMKVDVEILKKEGRQAVQYSTTEGYVPLRKQIAKRMKTSFHTDCTYEDIIITAGSQQGLSLLGQLFLNEGDIVLVESPTYLGAIGAFDFEQPRYIEVPTDDDGIIPEELEKYLESTPNVKFIYVIPNYQNPTGRCMSLERRKKMMELVTKYEIPVFEDNPYGDLRFEGEEIAPLITMDPKHLVMYSGTFSKTLAPGMRLAWMVCNDEILAKMDLVKGSTDLATPSVTQREVAMYMKNYDFEGHVQDNCKLYGHRRDVMCNAIKEYFPKDVKCTYPHGGLFLWVELPEGCNSRDLFKYALERKVAYVPGDAFFPESGKKNFFRLNFSYNDDDVTVEGVKRLADALKAYLADKK
mgnify:CR=1 FL=1